MKDRYQIRDIDGFPLAYADKLADLSSEIAACMAAGDFNSNQSGGRRRFIWDNLRQRQVDHKVICGS